MLVDGMKKVDRKFKKIVLVSEALRTPIVTSQSRRRLSIKTALPLLTSVLSKLLTFSQPFFPPSFSSSITIAFLFYSFSPYSCVSLVLTFHCHIPFNPHSLLPFVLSFLSFLFFFLFLVLSFHSLRSLSASKGKVLLFFLRFHSASFPSYGFISSSSGLSTSFSSYFRVLSLINDLSL